MAEPRDFHAGRHAGVLVPLFSIPSRASWGVGEIADLPLFARWLRAAGLDFVQLLPDQRNGGRPEFAVLGAERDGDRSGLPRARRGPRVRTTRAARRRSTVPIARAWTRCAPGPRVDFRTVRALKSLALHTAFHVFRDRHHGSDSDRVARVPRRSPSARRWWLEDYALFRALHDEHRGRYWRDWEPELRDRNPRGARARAPAAGRQHPLLPVPAVAGRRRSGSRAAPRCGDVGMFGDFPFMVSGHSADVWAQAARVPPRRLGRRAAGRVLGNRTGLGPARLSLGSRGSRPATSGSGSGPGAAAELYDGFRVDHLVGFYRTFVRERDGRSYFTPPDEPSQIAQGERLMRLFQERGARIIAEDLGIVPDFVRESLTRLHIPGLKVLRWERHWHSPRPTVPRSGATTPPSRWRSAARTIPIRWRNGGTAPSRRGTSPVRRDSGIARRRLRSRRAVQSPGPATRCLRALFSAGSDFVIVPFQDLFGWRDRVNVPAVVNDENWTWRLPWAIDELERPARGARARRIPARAGAGVRA